MTNTSRGSLIVSIFGKWHQTETLLRLKERKSGFSHPYLIEEVFKDEVVVVVAGGQLHVLQNGKAEVSARARRGTMLAKLVDEDADLVDEVVHQQVVLNNAGLQLLVVHHVLEGQDARITACSR